MRKARIVETAKNHHEVQTKTLFGWSFTGVIAYRTRQLAEDACMRCGWRVIG